MMTEADYKAYKTAAREAALKSFAPSLSYRKAFATAAQLRTALIAVGTMTVGTLVALGVIAGGWMFLVSAVAMWPMLKKMFMSKDRTAGAVPTSSFSSLSGKQRIALILGIVALGAVAYFLLGGVTLGALLLKIFTPFAHATMAGKLWLGVKLLGGLFMTKMALFKAADQTLDFSVGAVQYARRGGPAVAEAPKAVSSVDQASADESLHSRRPGPRS